MRPELILSKLAINLLFKSGKNSLTLKPGDTVQAKIVKFLENKNVLLNIKGTYVKAKMNTPPSTNTVKLYLKSLTPNVVFEILPSKTPVKATFIKILESNPEKTLKEIINSLDKNAKLQKTFTQNNIPAFLNFMFQENELQLTIEWFDEKENGNKNIKKLRFIFNTPSLKTSVIEFTEYANEIFINAFFIKEDIVKIAESLKEDFKNETGININFHTLTEEQNEVFTKSIFNAKYVDTSFDLKI